MCGGLREGKCGAFGRTNPGYLKFVCLSSFQAPIGTIDLANCRGQVVVAPRDICARLNTLMLEVKEDGERSRLLLSSDTKEEREMWKAQLNKSIVLMNSWSSSSK